jgi:hypothetical protein
MLIWGMFIVVLVVFHGYATLRFDRRRLRVCALKPRPDAMPDMVTGSMLPVHAIDKGGKPNATRDGESLSTAAHARSARRRRSVSKLPSPAKDVGQPKRLMACGKTGFEPPQIGVASGAVTGKIRSNMTTLPRPRRHSARIRLRRSSMTSTKDHPQWRKVLSVTTIPAFFRVSGLAYERQFRHRMGLTKPLLDQRKYI